MSNPIYMPIEDNFETTLRQQLDEDVADLTIYLNAVPEATLPVGYYFVGTLNPKTNLEENVIIESINTTLNTVTVKAASRAMAQGNSLAGTLRQHPVGSKFIISNPYLLYRDMIDAIVSKASASNQQFSGYIVVPVYADAAARDVAIPTPTNGTEVYLTSEGYFTDYTAGSWVARTPSASPPNATSTVAGKVELATDAEVTSGATTGGTGASLVGTPSQLAKSKQKDEHNYALDTGIVNAAVVALTPTLTAYTTGMRFSMKLAFTVTGPMTVNVDGLGAKTVKKKTDQDIATGDYKAGQMLEFRYDGTYMQCLTPVSTEFSPLTLTTLEAIDGSTTPQYVAYGSENMKDRIMIYDTNGEISATTGTNRNFGSVDALTRLSQSFSDTDALAASIAANDLTIVLRNSGAPTDNVTCEVQIDVAGVPSGTAITNGTSVAVTGGSLSTAYRCQKFTWATPPAITSGQSYWLVLRRSTANDAANFYQVLDAGGSTYAGGNAMTYTASTLTWASLGVDLKMQLVLNVSYAGKICKCDADNIRRSNGIGFVTANVGAASLADVYFDRYITFSGLTDGATYVASTTAGELVIDSSSPTNVDITTPTPHIEAGNVLGTKLKLTDLKKLTLIDDKIGTFTAVAGTSIDVLIPVGFRAREVRFGYLYNDASGPANGLGYAIDRKYVGLTDMGGTYVAAAYTASASGALLSTGSVTAALMNFGKATTTPWSAGVTLQAIYDNAILVRLTLDATADTLVLQSIELTK